MATPQDHYTEAERLLELAGTLGEQGEQIMRGSAEIKPDEYSVITQSLGFVIAMAQVHATLANAPVRSAVRHDNSMAGTHPWWTEAQR